MRYRKLAVKELDGNFRQLAVRHNEHDHTENDSVDDERRE